MDNNSLNALNKALYFVVIIHKDVFLNDLRV